MKAFAIKEKKIIEEINIEQPKMRPEEVLIEVHYLGLCGSDLNSYRGLMPLVTLPRIPGHEISGVIVDKGEAVPGNFQPGDKVTVSPYTSCGVCPACMIGRYNTCESNQTLGVQRDGALTKLISIPFDKVFVNNTLSLIELALVEPFSVGYHGANRGKVSETDTVLLLGCGTIGMGALVASVRKGARVIALDIDDTKLEQAKKFGAFYAINSSKTDALAEIRSITNNRGVNVVIEAVGTQSTYKLALDSVCFAGRIVLIGYSKNELTMDTSLIVRKELNMYGSRNALQVFPSVISMFEMKGKLYSELVTKIFPFAQAPEAFRFWDENTTGVSKILIDVKK